MGAGPKPERIDWVDAAKGLGIIAVVVGHIWTRGPLRDLIYAFHMPLFFILAGFVYRPRPLRDYAWRQIVSIGLPYAAFLLSLFAADYLVEHSRGRLPWLHGWAGLSRLLLGGSFLNGPYAIFWFPPCLLFARLIQNGLCQYFADPRSPGWMVIAGISLAVGSWIGWVSDVSPLGLLSVPTALFFLWVGHALRLTHIPPRAWWVALIPAGLALAFLPPMNMKFADPGFPLLSVAGAIAICLVTFALARWTPWLAPLGSASLLIMYVHVPIVHWLTPYLPKLALAALGLMVPLIGQEILRRHKLTALLFLGRQPVAAPARP